MKTFQRIEKAFIFSLLLLLLIFISFNTQAKDYTTTCNKDVVDKYVFSTPQIKDISAGRVEATVQNGQFKITAIDEGNFLTVRDAKTGQITNRTYVAKEESIHLIDNGKLAVDQIFDSSHPLNFNIKSYSGSEERYLRIVVVLIDDPKQLCPTEKETAEGFTPFTQEFYVELINFADTEPAKHENTNYNKGACVALRTGNNVGGVIPADIWRKYMPGSQAYYKQVVSYCYEPYVYTNYSENDILTLVKNAIDSNFTLNMTPVENNLGEFEGEFNFAKNQAHSQGGDHYHENTSPGINTGTLRCNYRKIRTKKDQGYEYVNKDYYYASQSTPFYATYTYNHEGEAPEVRTEHVCTRKCEEAVIVEYGPPEAAIAGFCIEYQVKITSRVKCYLDGGISGPPSQGPVCQPVPHCVHDNGWEATQAGPSDEFDRCISSCDGGKYTQSCSNKCYKKVYGKSTSKKLSFIERDNNVKKLAVESNGRYTRSSDGSIVWEGTGYARWYIDHEYGRTASDEWKFGADAGGFKRKDIQGGCNGRCSHIGCPGGVYLNASTAQEDYSRNISQYNNAVAQCKAAATCKTHTSTVTIEAKNPTTGIYDGKTSYQESVVSSQSNNLSQKKLTPVLANNGCYNGSEARNWYQLEWSFPGTWINNKTGEISYKEKDTNTWHKERDKFCLPLNAKNVNTNWWNWYMSLKNPGNSTNNSGSYTSKLYKSTCKDITNTAALSTIAGNNLDYNIKASARDFGYFKWNFNIECFYAVNDGSDITNTKKENEKYCTNSPDAYVTRPITNKDMFPSTEEGSSGITNPAETGRIPGYNWTESASIIKSTDYAVNPKELIKKIQDTKDKIYNDDATYLDYEFYLTPSDLRAIKSYGSKSKSSYSDWDASAIRYHKDSGIKGSGIYAYSSPLFRGNGPLATSGAARKLGVVACNNQARSGSCR